MKNIMKDRDEDFQPRYRLFRKFKIYCDDDQLYLDRWPLVMFKKLMGYRVYLHRFHRIDPACLHTTILGRFGR